MTVDTQAPEALVDTLSACGQEHLLRFWDELDNAGRQRLHSQLAVVNWALMPKWIEEYVINQPEVSIPADLEPAPYRPLKPRDTAEQTLYSRARERGRELLAAGKVAAFTVAGGQGTRLGYDGPKGTYPISPVKQKTLFQLFAESILRAEEKFNPSIPWFLLTSPVNNEATCEFFSANNFFGLDPENVKFITQGTMPAIGLDGKLLLGAKDSLALSPNGHGGSLTALRDGGALDLMAARAIEHISYWQVDNPLVYPFDPLFIGLHDLDGAEISCRSLTKTGPFEKLGNFCLSNGRVMIIEYSDMPDELSEAVDADGQLRYRAGSPAIHIIKRSFVEKLTDGGDLRLPFHRAEKKVPFIDEKGETQKPDKPNAVKLEMFIFDALPLAEKVLILEARREEQFGPVKNPTGVDSADSCRELLNERSAGWLEAAGIAVPRTNSGNADCVVELSPRRYLDAEDVASNCRHMRPPQRGGKEYYE
jgi:UDP-N-acetylglucosamine/UDP-N-acetylgalactosamine diphosphorylase